jgi:ribosomal protein L23
MLIKRPIVTEKGILSQAKSKYVFLVDNRATKSQITSEFFKLFGVKPLAVNTVTTKGNLKTDWKTRKTSKTSDLKKAIVTIKKDQKIDVLTIKNEK